MDIFEYQVIRPDGTVLLSQLAAEGTMISWPAEHPMHQIRGEMITRWRVCPDGKWTETARYPDGWQSNPVLP